ncbi:transporter substrate-binding domain-containing protein [Rubrimonas cliftonensis]|uniref:Amino acid ABC transporter substrate-binding protein, PAAT family n=1 Tax=Rubrimonas cliftonensis TaxID=89524 RepID=A0A1H3YN53_9RHOB|nr:transporter substrate-binding domain-containing protein [Rubrimonas cliftonensis]SEA12933.1 amino acid ABC transporter substrate-binding protein, PAAT family [Rubrimonas cliftonensis]
MLRSIAFAAAAFAAVIGHGADAQARSLDEVVASGVLRVGVNPTLPPLGLYNERNEIDGFDVEFSRRIAEMLGVELEVVQVGSPDRIPFVASGKIDYVMGAMTRNPQRAMIIDYTLPVHTEIFGVLSVEGKPYESWRDLNTPDATMVQVRGTTPLKFIEENLPEANVLLLDNYPDVVRALAQGRGDAMLDVVDFVGEHMNRHDVAWKVLETPVDVYYCGLGVQKGNSSLRDWLNVAIFTLHKDGVVDEIWKKWFGIDMLYPVGVTPYF